MVDVYAATYSDVYGGATGQATVSVAGQLLDPALVVAPIQLSWGRDDPTSQAAPPSATFTMENAPPTVGSEVLIDYDGIRRFTGVVSAVVSDGRRYTVTCHGRSSRLGRKVVGAPPWPEQTILQRLVNIANLAPGTTMAFGTGGGSLWWDELVTPVDVDRKPVLELLMDCAAQTGLMAWERFDGFLAFEPADWRALRAAATPRRIPPEWCRVGVDWGLDVGQIINRASLSYGTNNQEVIVSDADSIAAHGEHSVSVSTILATELAATRLGNAIVGRWKQPAWVLGQVTIDSARATGQEWFDTILGAQVSAVVSLPILDHPEQFPGSNRQLWILEGASEELYAGRHIVTWRLSPAHRYGVRALRYSDWKPSTYTTMKTRTYLSTLEGAVP